MTAIPALLRIKRTIREIADETAEAMRIGVPYQTRLDRPPADSLVAHEARLVGVGSQPFSRSSETQQGR